MESLPPTDALGELPNPGERVRVPGIDRPLWVRHGDDGRFLIDEVWLEPTAYQYGDEVEVAGTPDARRVTRHIRTGPHPTVWFRFAPQVSADRRAEMLKTLGNSGLYLETDDERVAVVMPAQNPHFRRLLESWERPGLIQVTRVTPWLSTRSGLNFALYWMSLGGAVAQMGLWIPAHGSDFSGPMAGAFAATCLLLLALLTLPQMRRASLWHHLWAIAVSLALGSFLLAYVGFVRTEATAIEIGLRRFDPTEPNLPLFIP